MTDHEILAALAVLAKSVMEPTDLGYTISTDRAARDADEMMKSGIDRQVVLAAVFVFGMRVQEHKIKSVAIDGNSTSH